jgi:hypothetical protein
MDIKSEYWQMDLHSNDKQEIAFSAGQMYGSS